MASLSGRSSSSYSRLVTAGAIIALVVISSVLVVVINASPMTSPLVRNYTRPADAPLPIDGTLIVRLLSNQGRGFAAPPLNAPSGLANWPLAVMSVNSSVMAEAPEPLQTDDGGYTDISLLPGLYLVLVRDQTLNIQLPVQISSCNATEVQLTISEAGYSVLYSEAADVAAQPSAYVQLLSSTQVANVGDPVVLEVREGGTGYQVNALVVAQQPPSHGTVWLKLVTTNVFTPANLGTVLFTTWNYSSIVHPPIPISEVPGFVGRGCPSPGH